MWNLCDGREPKVDFLVICSSVPPLNFPAYVFLTPLISPGCCLACTPSHLLLSFGSYSSTASMTYTVVFSSSRTRSPPSRAADRDEVAVLVAEHHEVGKFDHSVTSGTSRHTVLRLIALHAATPLLLEHRRRELTGRCAKVPKASFVAFEPRLVGKIRTLGARYYRTDGRRYNGINTEYVTQRGAQ